MTTQIFPHFSPPFIRLSPVDSLKFSVWYSGLIICHLYVLQISSQLWPVLFTLFMTCRVEMLIFAWIFEKDIINIGKSRPCWLEQRFPNRHLSAPIRQLPNSPLGFLLNQTSLSNTPNSNRSEFIITNPPYQHSQGHTEKESTAPAFIRFHVQLWWKSKHVKRHLWLQGNDVTSGYPPPYACTIASIVYDSLWPYELQPTWLLCPRDCPAKMLEGVAISSSRGSSWPRDRTHVSCVVGGFFTTKPVGKPAPRYISP